MEGAVYPIISKLIKSNDDSTSGGVKPNNTFEEQQSCGLMKARGQQNKEIKQRFVTVPKSSYCFPLC